MTTQRRLITKDRMTDMGINYEDVGLCDGVEIKDQKLLFMTWSWEVQVWKSLSQWMGIQLLQREMPITLRLIQSKH